MGLKRFSADISFATESGYSSKAQYRTQKSDIAENALMECAREIHMIAVRSQDAALMERLSDLFSCNG